MCCPYNLGQYTLVQVLFCVLDLVICTDALFDVFNVVGDSLIDTVV